ncbi:LamG domain-containing protein [Microbacterium resistens]|uniref:LamG domain-containing protein n=1 Tax=Microbacterium resistens TaxID=156977 RepID=A0ABY3RQ61_9MICO|nr:LamG domain-containing protein [Microbacterium resistens]UGS24994.1 LamG domain-containing protein [Microbacterium resistens]
MRTGVSFVVSAGLLVSGLLVPATAVTSVGSPVAAGSAPPLVSSEVATSSALQTAMATGEPVVVDELTTPTELTSAMPDGTLSREIATRPVRALKDDSWVPVDLTLVPVDGWLEPSATAVPVRFSSGGTDVISQIRTESGEWVSERWTGGVLPAPVVDGDTATYPEVKPGVDLKLVATKTGLASIYVVKDETAAKSMELADLRTRVEGAVLSRNPEGTIDADAPDGTELLSGQPLWWDSSNGGTYREPGGEAPPLPVAHDVIGDGLSMDVAESVAIEEKREPLEEIVYPIFVDPDWSTGQAASWYTDRAFPDTSYLSAGASDVLRVGVYQEFMSDMFFQFPLSAMGGKNVLNAVLFTTQLAVVACNPGNIQSHHVISHPPGFTWNQEQSWNLGWSAPIQQWGGPGCGSAPQQVSWSVVDPVRSAAGNPDVQLAFTFTNGSEYSRRHYSRDALLVVNYNTPPDVPTDPVIISPPRTCGTAGDPAVVGATDVTVQVNQTDPDGGNVDVNVHLYKASDLHNKVQDLHPGLGAQGPKRVTFTGLTNGTTYVWNARGSDWINDGVGFSPLCYFTVDTTKPPVPTVTTSATSFQVGTAVDVVLKGAAGVAGYVYWVTPGQIVSPAPSVPVDGTTTTTAGLPPCDGIVSASVRWACGNGATPVTVKVAPVDSLSTLWVSAYDRAGNQSLARGMALYPPSGGAPAASANLDAGHEWRVTSATTPPPATVADDNPWIGANAVTLSAPAGLWTTASDLRSPPLSMPVLRGANPANAAETLVTNKAPLNATNSFTLSMWVKPATLPATDYQIVATQYGPGRGWVQLRITKSGRYAFCIGGAPAADDNGRPVSNCATGGSVSLNSWQMVTGIWDAANKQLRLLVGNSITPVASIGHVVGSGDWSANGPLRLAPAGDKTRYAGLIANPMIAPGVIDHNQLALLAVLQLPFSQ